MSRESPSLAADARCNIPALASRLSRQTVPEIARAFLVQETTSHAAWDLDAVHGVHVMASVSELGHSLEPSKQCPSICPGRAGSR
jgi:hypothetical protein